MVGRVGVEPTPVRILSPMPLPIGLPSLDPYIIATPAQNTIRICVYQVAPIIQEARPCLSKTLHVECERCL